MAVEAPPAPAAAPTIVADRAPAPALANAPKVELRPTDFGEIKGQPLAKPGSAKSKMFDDLRKKADPNYKAPEAKPDDKIPDAKKPDEKPTPLPLLMLKANRARMLLAMIKPNRHQPPMARTTKSPR